MNIVIKSDYSKVIDSRAVLLTERNAELKLEIDVISDFSFAVILKFADDDSKDTEIEKEVMDQNIIFKCFNFKTPFGIGTKDPLPIATIDGKEWSLHFWSYTLGDGSSRKVEYTIFEKQKVITCLTMFKMCRLFVE